ncbi:DUF6612 family protein [Paenibacillus tengchongensis]|uniref:DUF6612 family protein n=1 Tax=Paenibacillus tengchongensis TaxID=2608684 RepID=UPI00124D0770|nr:DUF6612 family protein [Paenibacillus tengchongensis]
MLKKRGLTVALGMTLAMALTACGNNEAVNESAAATAESTAAATSGAENAAAAAAGANNTAATGQAQEGPISVDELITKAAEASQELQSFALDMEMTQNITASQGEDSQMQGIEMTAQSEYTKQPLQMHQVAKINMMGQGDQDIEQYVTQNGVYTQSDGQWFKMPASMTQQMTASLEQSASPEKQLEQFKSITEYTEVTEEGNEYLLTADVSGANVKELAQSYLNQAGGTDNSMTAAMDQMDIKSMNIVYGVDKETFFPTRTDVTIVMEAPADGQTISIDMTMTGVIDRHNEIAEIKVPEEALNAEEVELPETTTQQ